jgi:hypothetical protein
MDESTAPKVPQGVLYVATGASYLAEARRSAQSVKSLHPELPVCVVTDQGIGPDAQFDIVLPVANLPPTADEHFLARDRVAYYRKIQPLLESPFERTIFLDSDTWVAVPLDDLYQLLDQFEILVTPAHVVYDYKFERDEAPFSAIPAAFGYFNTGLLAFRKCPAVERFLQLWIENYRQHTAQFTVNDQPAFRLTLFQDVVKFHVLPAHYNIVSWVPFIVPAGGKIVMLHGRNRWLQKWVNVFKGGAGPMIVGGVSFRAVMAYQLARILHKFSGWFRSQRETP